MKYILFLLLVTMNLLSTGASSYSPVQETDHPVTDSSTPREIVHAAVFSLLEQTAPNKQQVKHVLKNNKLFITKCNLCSGTKAAFEQYAKQAGDVSASAHAVLFSTTDTDEQFDLLQVFVETAIHQYITHLPVSATEKQSIKEKLKAERLNSIMRLNVKKCATCDAIEHR